MHHTDNDSANPRSGLGNAQAGPAGVLVTRSKRTRSVAEERQRVVDRFHEVVGGSGGRFAVLSDIHSNLSALRAVLQFLDRAGISDVVSLGDLVGYGPHPCECIALLRERGIPSLAGNHDRYALEAAPRREISDDASVGIRHTRAVIGMAERRYLKALPFTCDVGELTFVHASLVRPSEWNYLLEPRDAVGHLRRQPGPVSFFGHTHVAGGFCSREGGYPEAVEQPEVIELGEDEKLAINPGSVGQPRDDDPRASVLVWDTRSRAAVYHRVAYDLDEAADAITRAGLPARLAWRLRNGF